jgi:hypothetical protein
MSRIAQLKGVHLIGSPHHSGTAFSLSTFPSRPIDIRSEGFLMAKNRRRTRKKRTKQNRRMSFMIIARRPIIPSSADWRDVM